MPAVKFTNHTRTSEKAYSRVETWSPTEGLTCTIELYFNWNERYKLLAEIANAPHQMCWPYTPDHSSQAGSFDEMRPIPVEARLTPIPNQKYGQNPGQENTSGCQGIDYETGIAALTYKMWAKERETVEFQTQSIRLDPKYFQWPEAEKPNDPLSIAGLDGLTQTVNRLILVKEFDNFTDVIPYNFYGTKTDLDQQDASTGYVGTVHDRTYFSSLIEAKDDPEQLPAGQQPVMEFVQFPPKTLLMLDPQLQNGPQSLIWPKVGNVVDTLSWRRGYRFRFRWLFRKEGHDKFWRPDKRVKQVVGPTTTYKRGGWDRVQVRGTKDTAGGITDNEYYTPFPPKNHAPFLKNTNLQGVVTAYPRPADQRNCVPYRYEVS